ncbi:MAG TPA: type II toxin-antitoxin system PemK/MazF family toxin [Candidatus Acidoferrales bacterium]|nr:type II toxin-antitoxin system PemK/MazF family toxin [Candidatus Acidoferrales bacterium]
MIPPKPGEVYWVDLGMRAKFRPLMVVSREDPNSERALSICVPCTTQIKGGNYEVPLPRVKWMPGSDDGVANVLGLESVEHHRFERRAGRYEAPVVAAVRKRIGWMLEI